MRGPLAIYSLAVQVLSLQIAVVALLLVTDLGMCVHTSNCVCPERKFPVGYLSLSVVESLLIAVSRQARILGGASVLCHPLQYVEKMRKLLSGVSLSGLA